MTETRLRGQVDIEIPFHDVDMMNVVWHGHYCKYLEIARCSLLEKLDYNYSEMSDSGYAWPVIDLRLRYIKPARFGQIVTVHAQIVEWENRLKIEYLIEDKASGVRMTTGYSIQVALKMPAMELCLESPPILFEKLGVAQS